MAKIQELFRQCDRIRDQFMAARKEYNQRTSPTSHVMVGQKRHGGQEACALPSRMAAKR